MQPFGEANSFSLSQEVHRTLGKPKLHYRIHKTPPPVPSLRKINPVHASSSNFLKMHFNILFFQFTPKS